MKMIGTELLDDRRADPHAVRNELRDIARLNTLFGAKSIDIVIASQVLHHLPRAVAVRWIASFDRVARRGVVLADLRRSRIAMAGAWLAGHALRMGATTRHDAVVSLRRGYTRVELTAMLREAGVSTVPRYRPGFRIVAAWEPCAPLIIS